ncbi:MAG: hypothetical protein AAF790_13475, partial [Planctomycetota bacterium]
AGLDADQAAAVCRALGMPMPEVDGLAKPDFDSQRPDSVTRAVMLWMLAKQGITPPAPITSDAEFKDWESAWQEELYDAWAAAQPDRPVKSDAAEPSGADADDAFGLGLGSMGVNPGPMSPFYYLEERAWDLIYSCSEQPWTAAECPPLAGWVARNDSNFALLQEAAQRPSYWLPPADLLTEPEATLVASFGRPEYRGLRGVVSCISIRTMLRVGEHQLAEAWEDLRLLFELIDRYPRDSLIDLLIACAWEGVASQAAEALLTERDLPVETATAMQSYFAARKPSYPLANIINGSERLLWLSSFTDAQEKGDFSEVLSDVLPDEAVGLSRMSIDWNVTLVRLNTLYNAGSAALKLPSYNAKVAALQKIVQSNAMADQHPPIAAYLSQAERSQFLADCYARGTYINASNLLLDPVEQADGFRRRLAVTAALAVHRLQTGAYPASLAELDALLLAKPPLGAYSGAPLVYEKTDNGYLLYDVGPNGKDDGGSNELMDSYRGYACYQDTPEGEIAGLLGEPEPGPNESLSDRIPADADDHATRVPLPPIDRSQYFDPDRDRQ